MWPTDPTLQAAATICLIAVVLLVLFLVGKGIDEDEHEE